MIEILDLSTDKLDNLLFVYARLKNKHLIRKGILQWKPKRIVAM